MKKIFTRLAMTLMISFIVWGVCSQKSDTVLLAAELTGFEIEEEIINETNGNIVNTSSKQLGIVTCINPETKEFVALGHSLANSKEGKAIEAICYDAQLRETGGKQLQAYLNEENPIGQAYYDSDYGIYGKMNNVAESKYQVVEIGTRYEIKKGEATILIRLDGENLESFEVEVEEISFLHNNHNIRIKITDENLISKTGGIVQGMSGTPLMQNGKLVGVINSVSASDATDAFAIFMDKIM